MSRQKQYSTWRDNVEKAQGNVFEVPRPIIDESEQTVDVGIFQVNKAVLAALQLRMQAAQTSIQCS